MNLGNILAGLFSGIIASMGMGGGAVLLIYLTVFGGAEQISAQGINLIFFIPIGLISIIIYAVKGKIQFGKILPMIIFGAAGSGLGILVTDLIDKNLLSKIFAFFLIFMGI
ncbi:MAG: sulfite exporter TauE/SafE family protein, partial [Clostridiales bacterium]|nr:sulfite exporter TauE/SafE family protein [Candidatus Equinaster intestinalis]